MPCHLGTIFGISLQKGNIREVHDCAGAWRAAGAMPGPSRIYCCITETYYACLKPSLLGTVDLRLWAWSTLPQRVYLSSNPAKITKKLATSTAGSCGAY